jgi:L-lactate dehydrogenase complex protein LldF
MGGEKRRIRTLPGAGGWTKHRDFPAPSGKTFMELYRQRRPRG